MIVYGNCQADAVAKILTLNPVMAKLFRIVYMRSFEHPADGVMSLPREDLQACAIVAQQHDPAPFPYRDSLPNGTPIVTFPSVDSTLLWPFTVPNRYNVPEPPHFPFGRFPYGDRVIMGCIEKGMAADAILAYYLGGWDEYKLHLDRLAEMEIARLHKRDALCDVKIADYVLANLRTRRLHWTVNHPSSDLLRELTVRLLRRCFNSNATVEGADISGTMQQYFGTRGPLGIIGVPIHPRVAERLEIEWYDYAEPQAYYGDRWLSYEEYYREFIANSLKQKDAGDPGA